MAEEGKEEALFKRVESLGLRIEYDSGFVAVARPDSADQRRDDDAEVEHAVLEQLGKHMREVASLAVGKARGARGRNFVGRQVFVPSIEVFGTLKDCSAEGIVTIAYRRQSLRDPDLDVDAIHSGSGADLLLILDDERPAPASKTSFAWIGQRTHADERFRGMFERAEAAGLTPAHDCGFTVVSHQPIAGVERAVAEKAIREIGHHLREVSVRLAARARGVRGRDFVGRRVLVPEFFNAFGIMESSNADGSVTVRYRDKHTKSERSCWCQGDDLLIVPDEEAAAATPAEPNSETTWQRLMRRAFGA
jgi:hypothetical protein